MAMARTPARRGRGLLPATVPPGEGRGPGPAAAAAASGSARRFRATLAAGLALAVGLLWLRHGRAEKHAVAGELAGLVLPAPGAFSPSHPTPEAEAEAPAAVARRALAPRPTGGGVPAGPEAAEAGWDRAFRAGAWQAPGDAIVQALVGASVRSDRAVANALKRQGLPTGVHEVLDAGAGLRENWAAVTEPDGNQYHLLKAPLNRDGTLGAATAKASAGCANLFNLFTNLDPAALREFEEGGMPARDILFPALVCVDVDASAASPVTLSTPSFSGRHISRECLDVERPCTAPRTLIRDGPFDPDSWDFLGAAHFRSRGVKQVAGFLLVAVLPLLPPDAKGSFVVSLADMAPSQPPGEKTRRLFYANGTPFVLHGQRGFSPWTGALPDYNTLAGKSDMRIYAALNTTAVPWGEKLSQVLFRGGAHGPHAPDPLYEDRLSPEQLFALAPGGGEGLAAATREAMYECAMTSQRVELTVWANSPANALRDKVDAKLTGLDVDGGSRRALLGQGLAKCHREAQDPGLYGLPTGDEVEYIPAAEWGRYKAVVVVDGHGPAYSFRNKLALDAVVLKMASPLVQEFERVVLPGVHYVPFTMQNVSAAVEYVLADENAAEMQAMVRRAHAALAEQLGLEKVAERMRDDLVRLWRGAAADAALDSDAENPRAAARVPEA